MLSPKGKTCSQSLSCGMYTFNIQGKEPYTCDFVEKKERKEKKKKKGGGGGGGGGGTFNRAGIHKCIISRFLSNLV